MATQVETTPIKDIWIRTGGHGRGGHGRSQFGAASRLAAPERKQRNPAHKQRPHDRPQPAAKRPFGERDIVPTASKTDSSKFH